MLWSLRELTRLAVTALVLVVGLGAALSATPPPAPTQLRPSAVSSRVTSVRPDAGPATTRAGQPAVAPPAGTLDTDTADTATATGPVATGPVYAPAIDPGRGTPARRGPPTS
ncbi:hypothetical protein [Micromonospora inaquosa]|uniref:Uncharacterized protein n=1 Tax=Micromonospora inaquosa TaxID=2203716 RepID=A0A3N9WU39_9ACTN|nr:hypothetical protein [Micromonospora inaquosa]RQX04362.1 hypothetical protein DLJ59_09660 [Micromonospora inaquosa]